MRRAIIKDLLADNQSRCYRNFFKLFDCLLEEARALNDIAPIDEVPKIQGEIRVIKKLLKELNPNRKPIQHYDGGFGE